MSSSLRSLALAAAMAAAGALPAAAQSVFDAELRAAPQFMQYRIKAPADETVSESVLPVFVSIPFSSSFTFDVGTAYARAHVSNNGGTSDISGLTDTQLRGNLTLGSDFVILTLGLNLPTGRSSVTLDEYTAASRIGNDFLAFPVSSMGSGFALTGGIAVARPFGDWNLGFGAAVRRSNSYEPFNIPDQQLTFTPGNEYRMRVGVDRTVGDGRVALGLTYSKFGQDDAGGTLYNSGDRIIAQTTYSTLVGGRELVVGGYDMYRRPGVYASGDPSGAENLLNAFASTTVQAGGAALEPSLELKHWLQNVPGITSGTTTTDDRSQSSVLATLNVRMRTEVLGVGVVPSVGYSVGSLAMVDAIGVPVSAGMSGFRAQIAMRVTPFGQ